MEHTVEALRPAGLPTRENFPLATAGLYTIRRIGTAGYSGLQPGMRSQEPQPGLARRWQWIVSGLGADFQPRSRHPHFNIAIGAAGCGPGRVAQRVLVA